MSLILRAALIIFSIARLASAEFIDFADKDIADKLAAEAKKLVPESPENKTAYTKMIYSLYGRLRDVASTTKDWEGVVAKFITEVHSPSGAYGNSTAIDAFLTVLIRNTKNYAVAKRVPYPTSALLKVISAAENTGRPGLSEVTGEMYKAAFAAQSKKVGTRAPEYSQTGELFRMATSKGIQPPPLSEAEVIRALIPAVQVQDNFDPDKALKRFMEYMRKPGTQEARWSAQDAPVLANERSTILATFDGLITKPRPPREILTAAMKIAQSPEHTSIRNELDRRIYATVELNPDVKKALSDPTKTIPQWTEIKRRVESSPGGTWAAVQVARERYIASASVPGVDREVIEASLPDHLKLKPVEKLEQWNDILNGLRALNTGVPGFEGLIHELKNARLRTDPNLFGSDIVTKLTSIVESDVKEAELASFLKEIMPHLTKLRADATGIHTFIKALEQRSTGNEGRLLDRMRAQAYEWGFANCRDANEFAALSGTLFGGPSKRSLFNREDLGRVLAKGLAATGMKKGQSVADSLDFVLRQAEDAKSYKYGTFADRMGSNDFSPKKWFELALDHIRSSKDAKMLDAVLNLLPPGANPAGLKPDSRQALERAVYDAITTHPENAELLTRKNYVPLALKFKTASGAPGGSGGAASGGAAGGRMIRDTGNPMDTMMRPAGSRSRHDQPSPCPFEMLK